MSKNRKLFIKLLTKRLVIMTSSIIIIVVCLSSLLLYVTRQSQSHYRLLNVLDEQKTLTQTIAKDASLKYSALHAQNNGTYVLSREELSNTIDSLNQSLKASQIEFNATLSATNSEILKHGKLPINMNDSFSQLKISVQDVNDLWLNFNRAAETIKNSHKIDYETSEAIVYINDNNKPLLTHYNNITLTLIDIYTQSSFYIMWICFFLFISFLILLTLSAYQLHRYIIIPLNEVYRGISGWKPIKSTINTLAPLDSEIRPVIAEIHEDFEKLNTIISLIKNMNQNKSFNEVLAYIYKSFSLFIPYSHIGIALLRDDGKTLEASYGISDDSTKELAKKLFGLKVEVSQTSLGRILSEGRPRVINDFTAYTVGSSDKSYNSIIKNAGINASITLPLKINGQPVGVIFFSSTSKNIYKTEHIQFLEMLADSIAISLNQNIFIDELLYSSILALAKLAESRDEDTGEHLERMKLYSEKFTELLLEDNKYTDIITPEFIRDITRFSPMHDIGKVGIRDGILLKPGKLTVEEFEEMKKHTTYGADVLRAAENNISKQGKHLFRLGIEIAEGHHEKWNGTGYPYKKAGEQIPLSARIVTLADVFDALTSKRHYKEAFSFEDSFEIIVNDSGKHFDPCIVDTLIKHKEEVYSYYLQFRK